MYYLNTIPEIRIEAILSKFVSSKELIFAAMVCLGGSVGCASSW